MQEFRFGEVIDEIIFYSCIMAGNGKLMHL